MLGFGLLGCVRGRARETEARAGVVARADVVARVVAAAVAGVAASRSSCRSTTSATRAS